MALLAGQIWPVSLLTRSGDDNPFAPVGRKVKADTARSISGVAAMFGRVVVLARLVAAGACRVGHPSRKE
jgi:hypothetical protein